MSENAAKKSNAQRVQRHRLALRASGLRPLQIWVPDTKSPSFKAQVSQQSKLVCLADDRDHDLMEFLDNALIDVADFTQ